jgi:hypothetical protein
MSIYEALKSIDPKKAMYFQYKFSDLRYYQERPMKTEEDFLRQVERKSMNPFYKWEKSAEYKNLVQLYLDTKIADDYKEIYDIVISKAKEGDEKSIRLFLSLQKDISVNSKLAAKQFENAHEDEKDEIGDDLVLD